MIDLHPGIVRFVAFSLVNGEPYTSGLTIVKALDNARHLAAFGIGHHPHVEVLDCGGETEDVLLEQTSLAIARSRFPTVYRAEADGLLPAPLLSAAE